MPSPHATPTQAGCCRRLVFFVSDCFDAMSSQWHPRRLQAKRDTARAPTYGVRVSKRTPRLERIQAILGVLCRNLVCTYPNLFKPLKRPLIAFKRHCDCPGDCACGCACVCALARADSVRSICICFTTPRPSPREIPRVCSRFTWVAT